MYKYYLIAFASTVFTAISQLLLKFGALHGNKHNSLVRAYLNPSTLFGYLLLFFVTFLSVYAYQFIDLKIGVVLFPMTFVFVALLSFVALKEKFSKNNTIGAAIILAGIVVFSL